MQTRIFTVPSSDFRIQVRTISYSGSRYFLTLDRVQVFHRHLNIITQLIEHFRVLFSLLNYYLLPTYYVPRPAK